MAGKIIPGLHLVYQTGGRRQTEDASMLYKLEGNFSPPEFMNVAFIMMHGGSEEIIVQGKTLEVLKKFIKENDYERHPRLRWLKITGPKGVEYEYPEKGIISNSQEATKVDG